MIYSAYDPTYLENSDSYIHLDDHRIGLNVKVYGTLVILLKSVNVVTRSIWMYNKIMQTGKSNTVSLLDCKVIDLSGISHNAIISLNPGEHNSEEINDIQGRLVLKHDYKWIKHIKEMVSGRNALPDSIQVEFDKHTVDKTKEYSGQVKMNI